MIIFPPFLSYTHLPNFLCCFCFNIFLLVVPDHDLRWACEEFNVNTMHFQLISNSLQLFIIMASFKSNLLANLFVQNQSNILLISLVFFFGYGTDSDHYTCSI